MVCEAAAGVEVGEPLSVEAARGARGMSLTDTPSRGALATRHEFGLGGAALSMRHVTGKPIKFAGTVEKLDAIEAFDPKRVAGRILGMGDVVSLVEKAAATIKEEEAAAMAKRMA